MNNSTPKELKTAIQFLEDFSINNYTYNEKNAKSGMWFNNGIENIAVFWFNICTCQLNFEKYYTNFFFFYDEQQALKEQSCFAYKNKCFCNMHCTYENTFEERKAAKQFDEFLEAKNAKKCYINKWLYYDVTKYIPQKLIESIFRITQSHVGV